MTASIVFISVMAHRAKLAFHRTSSFSA